MLRNLVAVLYLGLGAYWAYWLHRRIFRAVGRHRWGRFGAYLAATMCYFVGMGFNGALYNDGWHRSRRSLHETHTSLPEAMVVSTVLAVILGVGFFVQGERRGGMPFFDDEQPVAEFPPDYTRDILNAESNASVSERAAMARWLERRARESRQSLPPELAASIERNGAGRPPSERSGG